MSQSHQTLLISPKKSKKKSNPYLLNVEYYHDLPLPMANTSNTKSTQLVLHKKPITFMDYLVLANSYRIEAELAFKAEIQAKSSLLEEKNETGNKEKEFFSLCHDKLMIAYALLQKATKSTSISKDLLNQELASIEECVNKIRPHVHHFSMRNRTPLNIKRINSNGELHSASLMIYNKPVTNKDYFELVKLLWKQTTNQYSENHPKNRVDYYADNAYSFPSTPNNPEKSQYDIQQFIAALCEDLVKQDYTDAARYLDAAKIDIEMYLSKQLADKAQASAKMNIEIASETPKQQTQCYATIFSTEKTKPNDVSDPTAIASSLILPAHLCGVA